MQNMPTISKKINASNPSQKLIEATKVWQRFIGVTDDGAFGPKTDAATRDYQKKLGLTADGIVGKNTWSTVPDVGPPTPQQAAIKSENAAVTASQKIAAPAPKVPTAKPQPTPVPAPAPAKVATAAVPKAAQAVKKTATAAVTKTTEAVSQAATQTKDVFVKQPLWIRIVTATALVIGAIAGIKLMNEPRRKSA